MKNATNEQKIQKTQVFNLIILDRSGSMSLIRDAAIDGLNETLAGIRTAQEKFADTQDHYVSLVTFCGCEIGHTFDKTPVAETVPLKPKDYVPCCSTPLLDAMGYALTTLDKYMQEQEDAVAVVTIITDGMENSSKEYDRKTIRTLVERLRGEGWTFTYMGANQDSIEVAETLSIRNARNFTFCANGAIGAMLKDSRTRLGLFGVLAQRKREEAENCCAPMSAKERHNLYTAMADEAFDEEERINNPL